MVHQYQLNGYNIVLDTCSGAIHVVDEVAYDIIALYPDHTADEIVTAMMEKYGAREDVTEKDLRDCIDDVEALKQAGKLYTPDTFADMAGTFKERSGDVVKALCLHVAHTCNLNCSYCFASQGKYHGDRALMSFEVGKQALDFLMDHSGSRTNLEVDFFGGEPLMNWDVVKQLVEYARSVEKERGKNFRFTLTTNGMLIDDDVIDFANREMSNVVLSLDGRKEIHDRLRVDYAGNGSYERIVPKFQKLVEARGNKNYYMRGTFTHANPDFTKDLFHMADLGFTELSMEPVVCAPEDPAALTAEDLEIVKDQYELLAKDMLRREKEGKPITFYHYMLDLTGGPCIYKRISGIQNEEEYDDMLEELMDRFGEPPKAVQNLLAVANLKAMAHKVWLTEVTQKGDEIRFILFERAKVEPVKIESLVKNSKGRMKFVMGEKPYFSYSKPRKSGKDNEDILQTVREILVEMGA